MLGVWWAGHMVPQVHWHPAQNFSKFWFATLNTSMGHAQQFAKISIEQLVLSLVPLCYLYYGWAGLALATGSVGYFWMQLKTWGFLMGRMRTLYEQGYRAGKPVVNDVSDLPCSCCSRAHMGSLLGFLTGQLIGTAIFAFRWTRSRADRAVQERDTVQP